MQWILGTLGSNGKNFLVAGLFGRVVIEEPGPPARSKKFMHRFLPATRIAGRRIANVSRHRNAFTSFLSQPHLRIVENPSTPGALTHSSFHTSASRRDEAPKSPFQVFREVLSEEIKKNRELEQNVAQLKGEVGKVQDSETLKQARQAYERARVEYPSFFYQHEWGRADYFHGSCFSS